MELGIQVNSLDQAFLSQKVTGSSSSLENGILSEAEMQVSQPFASPSSFLWEARASIEEYPAAKRCCPDLVKHMYIASFIIYQFQ